MSSYIKKVNTDDYFKYSFEFIYIKILEQFYYNDKLSFEDIYNNLFNYLDSDELSLNDLFNLLIIKFNYQYGKFSILEKNKSLVNKFRRFENIYYKYSNYSYEEMCKLENNYCFGIKNNYVEGLAYFIARENIQNNQFDEHGFLKVLYLLEIQDTAIEVFDNLINNDQIEDIELIDEFFSNEDLKAIFIKYNLKNMKQLKDCSLAFILNSFYNYFNNFIEIFYNYLGIYDSNYFFGKNDINIIVSDLLDEAIGKLNNKEFVIDVFNKRNAIKNNRETLEEIGKYYNLTRERIRQIENQFSTKLIKLYKKYQMLIDTCLNKEINKEKKYITLNELIDLIGENDSILIIHYAQNSNNLIKFDKEYKIIYNICEFIPEIEIKKSIKVLGDYVTKDNFNKLDDFKKYVVTNNYKLKFNDDVYVKNNIKQNDLIFDLLDDIFPNGFRIGSNEDHEYLQKNISDKFKTNYKIASLHSLQGLLARNNYILIDKGTFLNKKFIPELDIEFLNKILSYIATCEDVIYYSTIYEKFKEKLGFYGINNRYFLKGVLDDYLPTEYSHKRDYISIGKSFKTPYDVIVKYIINESNIIYMDDLRKKFPGVKDYTFMNYIDTIEDSIWIKYDDSFILGRNIDINEKILLSLNEDVKILLKLMKSDVISTKKLYSRIKIMNPQIFNEISLFDTPFAFYSLLAYFFKDKYYFSRPYLSINNDKNITSSSILLNYVKKLDVINLNIINNYTNKMHITPLFSYLDFLDEHSDIFVQVNKEEAVKKQFININDNILNEILYQIKYYIESYGCIDTTKFFDFCSLPRINYTWNKYLLIGIIRSYLSNTFDIEYTDSSYKYTDFIIRRIK